MKEEITIKQIKEAKAELERNLTKMIGDFELKYGIEVYSVGFDSIKHRDELGNWTIREIRANVELNLI